MLNDVKLFQLILKKENKYANKRVDYKYNF